MTKQEMKDFLLQNYCDIEADLLPRQGQLPSKHRLLKRSETELLYKKAEAKFGQDFADYLEINTVKTLLEEFLNYWSMVFWIDSENWDKLYSSWQVYKNNKSSGN